MIDPNWFAQAAMMADVSLKEEEPERFSQELGDERELLPWLLIVRKGFTDWPETRAALAEAAKSVIRPRSLAQQVRCSAMTEEREACKQAQLRAINVSQENDRWAVDETIGYRQRFSHRPQPNDFIATS